MSFERSEIVELRKEQREERQRETRQALDQARVEAEKLTGDPAWDVYIQQLQAKLEKAQAKRDGMVQQLADPTIVSRETIMLAKLSIANADGYIAALNEAIGLPAQLKEGPVPAQST